MAIVELKDSVSAGEMEVSFTVEVSELLAGLMPVGGVILEKFGAGTCSQFRFITERARGLLIATVIDGKVAPDFCRLENSFFQMNGDTVFVPLFDDRSREYFQPYTLEEFRMNSCINFSPSKDVLPADDAFILSYAAQSSMLQVTSLDPAIRLENVRIDIYSSNGQHLLEAQPAGPIDMSTMPPGMYAFLIRDEQRAWSKAFVKPN